MKKLYTAFYLYMEGKEPKTGSVDFVFDEDSPLLLKLEYIANFIENSGKAATMVIDIIPCTEIKATPSLLDAIKKSFEPVFQIGQVVKLKSGGQAMTVEDAGIDTMRLAWINKESGKWERQLVTTELAKKILTIIE